MAMCSDKKRILAGGIFTVICIVLCAAGVWGCAHIRRSGRDQAKTAGMDNVGHSGTRDTGSEGRKDITPDSVTRTMEQILLWQCTEYGVSNVQELLDNAYAERAENGTVQTYVLGLYGYMQKYDYMRYVSAVQNVLRDNEVSAISMQKLTMVLCALQADNPVPAELLEETIGKQGMMSELYGLLMLDGMTAADGAWTRDSLVQEILSGQLPDGGFAIAGAEGDVDVTAMALQALAPYYLKAQKEAHDAAETESEAQIIQTVEDALAFLSAKQLLTGDFANSGTPNAESTAQVILALCALKRDVWTDAMFIKEGVSLLDGLSRYQNADGGFSHTADAASNDMASSQVFAALSAVNRWMSGECFLYDFAAYDRAAAGEQDLSKYEDSLILEQGNNSHNTSEQEYIPTDNFNMRAPLIVLVLAAGCGYLAYLCFCDKYSRKRLGGILFVAAVLVTAIRFVRIQTREAYLRQDSGRGGKNSITVSVEIRCDTVAGAEEFLPQDGVILAKTPVSAGEGESAFDVLRETAKLYDIPLEYAGTAAGDEFAYVEGIAYLYEYDHGELSGWIFFINGETQDVGCGAYQVADGDEILWYYTKELGRDVKFDSSIMEQE